MCVRDLVCECMALWAEPNEPSTKLASYIVSCLNYATFR